MRGRVIFYVGQMETLDLFTLELVEAFRIMDYEIMIYDLRDQKKSLINLEMFCKKPVDAVITFNTTFYNMQMANGNNAWKELGITYITILVDHPDNFRETLKVFSENEVVLCIDRKHMDYIGRFYPNIVTYGFLPHGGSERYCEKEKLPFAKRKMDVMYAGGIPNADVNMFKVPNSICEKYEEFFDAEEIAIEVYQYLQSNPIYTVEQGIEQVMHNKGFYVDDDVLECIISDFMFIHIYVLSYYRAKVLEVVAKAGLELYIYGYGWERFDWTSLSNVHLMGMISAEQVLEEMCNAKVVLTTMAWFKDGAHERVFNGILSKALVFSENSEYMSEIFQGVDGDLEQDVMLYELDDLSRLPQRIEYMLNHEEEAEEIIDRGYSKVKQLHTWEMRAREMDKELLQENSNIKVSCEEIR